MRIWGVLGGSLGASAAFAVVVYFVVGALDGSFDVPSKTGLEFAGDYRTVEAQEWKRLILAGNGLCQRYQLRYQDQPVGEPELGTWTIAGPNRIALHWKGGTVEQGSVLGLVEGHHALEIDGTRYFDPESCGFGY
jgi:hypothetical protein